MTDPAARQGVAGTRFTDVRFVDEVGSTNDEVMALAAEDAPEGIVVVARHQTAGRGRAGRSWVAPPGSSLLLSMLLRPSLSPDFLPLTTLATALAAADACHDVGGFRPQLKWPNDLVVGAAGHERKLAGILAEVRVPTLRSRAERHRSGPVTDVPVVMGVGLNVAWDSPPAEIAEIAVTASAAARRPVDSDALLASFLRHFDARYGSLETTEGRDRILTEYRRRCCTLGRRVRAEMPSRTIEGRALDIDPKGNLVVQTDAGGQTTVRAGDVTHLGESADAGSSPI